MTWTALEARVIEDYGRACASAANSLALRQPLTDGAIDDLACEWVYIGGGSSAYERYVELRKFARAIEAAHGISASGGEVRNAG